MRSGGEGRERARASRSFRPLPERWRHDHGVRNKTKDAATERRVHDGHDVCQSDSKDEGLGCRTLECRFNMPMRNTHEYGMGNRRVVMIPRHEVWRRGDGRGVSCKCEEFRFRLMDGDERTRLAKSSNGMGRRTFPNTYLIPLHIHIR